MSGGESDSDGMLQAKLTDLEKEVEALRLQKQQLEQLLQQPVEFRSLASKKHVARTANTQKYFLQFENNLLLKKLMFQRLSGDFLGHNTIKTKVKMHNESWAYIRDCD